MSHWLDVLLKPVIGLTIYTGAKMSVHSCFTREALFFNIPYSLFVKNTSYLFINKKYLLLFEV